MHTTTILDVRGTSIRVLRGGRGAPLLLLRGTDASDGWLPIMDRLAERFDVIVPEHPGFGGKPLPAWLDRVTDLACFYLDLIDHMGLVGVHIVGSSIGGWIAADIAARDCHKLGTLTLVGAAGLRVRGATGVDIFMRTEEQAVRDCFHDASKAEATASRLLTPETEDVRLNNAAVIARIAWEPRLHDPQLAKWLHRITVPTLVVWGGQDRVFPPVHADAFASGIAGARREIVPDCGHWVLHERPDALATAIERFAGKAAKETG